MSFVTGGRTIYLQAPRKGDATLAVVQDPLNVVFSEVQSGTADVDAPEETTGHLGAPNTVLGRVVG